MHKTQPYFVSTYSVLNHSKKNRKREKLGCHVLGLELFKKIKKNSVQWEGTIESLGRQGSETFLKI
jgi:hypothetical protein